MADSAPRYCGPSQYASQGERVVAGQHLMQAESDIFLVTGYAVEDRHPGELPVGDRRAPRPAD
jgi:hypothetical protein